MIEPFGTHPSPLVSPTPGAADLPGISILIDRPTTEHRASSDWSVK